MLTLLLFLACAGTQPVEVISEESCAIPAEGWFPLHLEGFEASAFESAGIVATRLVYSPPVASPWAAWSVTEGEGGSFTCTEIDASGTPVITEFQPADGGGLQALACVSGGDTLWTCLLEGTDEFENGPVAAGSQELGYLVRSRPDCNGDWTRVARISPDGETVFSTLLTSIYLLDLPEPVGEIGPSIASLDLTASGDVIVAGRVSQWFTSPEAWFVCLLDGETGTPVWKVTGYGMGLAGLHQAVEAPSGTFVGVGATSTSGDPGQPWVWGEEHPLVVVIGPDGTVIAEETPDLETAGALGGVAALDSEGAFLAAGVDPDQGATVLARLRINAGTD